MDEDQGNPNANPFNTKHWVFFYILYTHDIEALKKKKKLNNLPRATNLGPRASLVAHLIKNPPAMLET